MNDAEIVRKCAEAMESPPTLPGASDTWNLTITLTEGGPIAHTWVKSSYNPLENDAQAMALVKKFGLNIEFFYWQGPRVSKIDAHHNLIAEAQHFESDSLNRAICECVAKMQEAKCASPT